VQLAVALRPTLDLDRAPPVEAAFAAAEARLRAFAGSGARALAILRGVASAWDLDVERAYVERAKGGDRQALRLLLERFGPVLFRSVLLPRLGDEARAKDALADTYTRVVTSIARYEWHPAGIYPWLRTIAFHVAIDQLRARKRETPWEAEALEREIDAHAGAQRGHGEGASTDLRYVEAEEAAIARAKIEAALATIHPRYAQAIRLRVLEERPREEVAAALSATPATFDVILHRAMAAMRKAMGVGEPEAEAAGAGAGAGTRTKATQGAKR
jgi:RNA polymerase sigma-70 factor (ECF subfamily)